MTNSPVIIIIEWKEKVKECATDLKDLTKGNIFKTFFLFGLPLVLSGVLTQAYSTVDTVIAGKFLGDIGLAAIGATAPLITLINSVFWGYGVGFSIYIARLFSSGEHKKIKSVIYTNFLMLFVACTLLSVLLIVFHGQVFDLLRIDGGLQKEAFLYFAIDMAGRFLLLLPTLFMFVLTAFGIGSFPFFMSLITTAVNIGGNLLCVGVLGTGVEGLAISSVAAAVVVDILYLFKMRRCFQELGVDKERVKLRFRYIKHALPYALPNMGQQMVMYVSTCCISPFVNGLGPSASASYAVTERVYSLCTSVYQNSARAVSNYTAQSLGAEDCSTKNLRKGVWVGLLQGIAFTLPFALVCIFLHEPVCSLFLRADADALTREYSYLFARSYLPFVFINLVNNLLHAFYRGAKASGHLFFTTLIGAVAQVIAVASLVPTLGMEGFFLGRTVSWGAEAVFSVALFFFGFWIPEKIRERGR